MRLMNKWCNLPVHKQIAVFTIVYQRSKGQLPSGLFTNENRACAKQKISA